jgi:hypothetical protein
VQYVVSVSTLTDPDSSPRETFVILPSAQASDTNDLQFREVRNYLKRALISRGLVPTDGRATPQLAIFVAYGIGEPRTQTYSYSFPVWGRLPGSTTNVTATTTGNSGSSTTTGTATTQPTSGIVGNASGTSSVTTYTRYMLIQAVDIGLYQQTQVFREAWRTNIISTGTSGDLRVILPVLVAAAVPYLGTQTTHAIEVKLKDSDSRLTAIRGHK